MDLTATEDILRNPAALHSLKRDQLIRLCKIHGVKASGKNVDIAERLANIPLKATQQVPQSQLVTIKEDTVTSIGTTKTGSDFGSVKCVSVKQTSLTSPHPKYSIIIIKIYCVFFRFHFAQNHLYSAHVNIHHRYLSTIYNVITSLI
ncbi:uncharacterized protein EV420DRAFT_4937 [Desarmillaria tabescens]|uniref:SAP domain-containing protein n=1 Tax=Armillaria tabescens TaxID=1929756 RepID=A0AA39NNT6_ARMTA|nr:uncharacterized protein EV420DRAFT_4937 [Desarmillaria tabescens]KAK0469041.1 hypothetical protein EV420DRAFT_4937 [Desarmillaria tabescens]